MRSADHPSLSPAAAAKSAGLGTLAIYSVTLEAVASALHYAAAREHARKVRP